MFDLYFNEEKLNRWKCLFILCGWEKAFFSVVVIVMFLFEEGSSPCLRSFSQHAVYFTAYLLTSETLEYFEFDDILIQQGKIIRIVMQLYM